MTKAELISLVAEKADMTKKDADVAVNAVVDAITEALVSGDKIALVGFGTFETRDRAEKVCKNPQTGEPITVAATRVPAFKAGKSLKEAVAGK